MTQRCIAGGIWSKTISPKSRSSAPSPRDTTRQSKASAPTSTLPLRSSPQGKCQQTLALAAIHFAQAGVSVSMAVFIALMIKGLGLTNMQTGWLTAVPFVFGTIGILVWGHLSDRLNERKWNLAASCLCMAAGMGLAALLDGSYWSVAGLSLAMIGLYAGNAHLFPIPSMFLTGAAAASGIAWVNSLGVLAGAVNPPILGWLKDSTGNYQSGLYFLAVLSVIGAIITVIGVRETAAKLSLGVVPAAE